MSYKNLIANHNSKTSNIEDKILDITNFVTNATLNSKIDKVKGEIPSKIPT